MESTRTSHSDDDEVCFISGRKRQKQTHVDAPHAAEETSPSTSGQGRTALSQGRGSDNDSYIGRDDLTEATHIEKNY